MEQELEVNVVELEDNEEYIVFEALENKGNKYLFLTKENDEFDIRIRKIIKKDEKDYLVKLDSNEEFEEIMNLYYKKHQKKEGI